MNKRPQRAIPCFHFFLAFSFLSVPECTYVSYVSGIWRADTGGAEGKKGVFPRPVTIAIFARKEGGRFRDISFDVGSMQVGRKEG